MDISKLGPPCSVFNLDTACQAYWNSHSWRENQAAYHEMLLFGARDGWYDAGWRLTAARVLRRLALWIEGSR